VAKAVSSNPSLTKKKKKEKEKEKKKPPIKVCCNYFIRNTPVPGFFKNTVSSSFFGSYG
jgi:hypothetical protein